MSFTVNGFGVLVGEKKVRGCIARCWSACCRWQHDIACACCFLCPLIISSVAAQLSDAGAYTFSIIVALFPTLPIGLVGLGEQPSARLPFCCTPPLPLVGV